MSHQKAIDVLSGRDQSAGAKILRPVLGVLSKPYSSIMRLRRWAYRKGIKKSHSADIPVVCVGNITTGGTGKTPMVALVCEILKSAGMSPAILTRGYKSIAGRSDEAVLLEQICQSSVIVEPDRVKGARQAAESGADVIVMDDGFQHMRLRRDLNIVLIDATNPFGFGKCLPAGLLREPLSALNDADLCVITRSDLVAPEDLDIIIEKLGLEYSFEVFTASHKPTGWVAPDGEEKPLDAVARDTKAIGFCGLGNPDAFFSTLKKLGVEPVKTVALADHADYKPEDIENLNTLSEQLAADIFITTQKDFTKIDSADLAKPLWQLAVKMEVDDNESFTDLLVENIAKRDN